ncbi:MAG: hypothetical protein ACJAZ3_000774 [Sphingobacteriales bacterium]|jgi:hypothetical protein
MKKFILTFTLLTFLFQSWAQDCVLFSEGFNGSSDWEQMLLPYGLAGTCAFAAGAVFGNSGTEDTISVVSYFEAALRKREFNLPDGDYRITVKWRTSEDGPERADGCGGTNFDDLFQAGCLLPNRVFVINDQMVHNVAGELDFFNETFTVDYSGPIDSITFAVGGNCATAPFNTAYDSIEIIPGNNLPIPDFSYIVVGNEVRFTDLSANIDEGTHFWDFGDDNISTEQNPIHTYTKGGVFFAKLTVSNTCGEKSKEQFFNIALGISDNKQNNLPVNVMFDIESQLISIHSINPSEKYEAILFNSLGQEIYRIKDLIYSGGFGVSGLSSGNYVVAILDDNGQKETHKIIIP